MDWLAAGTFDRAVGLSLFTLQVTHRIEADIDVERDFLVASLAEGTPGLEVHVLPDFSAGYHSRNGGGDSVHTDGDLPVVAIPDPQGRTPEPPRVPDVVPIDRDQLRARAREPRPGSARRKRSSFEVDVPLDAGSPARRRRPPSVTMGAVILLVRTLVLGAILAWAAVIEADLADGAPYRRARTPPCSRAPVRVSCSVSWRC
ncbi:hypothetical protein GCM10025875_25100 [Litorihabitans aurantiacus]|uniref:LssY-like C-terminal domain-containing protein n=1 Tax=Litorihabitans aurantiacus TaxID=1930061 RepID=A0AA37XFL7_9MICO|nr:hypothetical protein GCM10025875_25100 [Litorihabitans aurantiacus]